MFENVMCNATNNNNKKKYFHFLIITSFGLPRNIFFWKMKVFENTNNLIFGTFLNKRCLTFYQFLNFPQKCIKMIILNETPSGNSSVAEWVTDCPPDTYSLVEQSANSKCDWAANITFSKTKMQGACKVSPGEEPLRGSGV